MLSTPHYHHHHHHHHHHHQFLKNTPVSKNPTFLAAKSQGLKMKSSSSTSSCVSIKDQQKNDTVHVMTYNDDVEIRHQVIRKHPHQHLIFTHSFKPVTFLLETQVVLGVKLLL